MNDQATLTMALQLTVPLWIDELRSLRPDVRAATMAEWRALARTALPRADVMLYGGSKSGMATEIFNGLARGLAVLAHSPGGVGFAGLHWCVGSGHTGIRTITPCEDECRRGRAPGLKVATCRECSANLAARGKRGPGQRTHVARGLCRGCYKRAHRDRRLDQFPLLNAAESPAVIDVHLPPWED